MPGLSDEPPIYSFTAQVVETDKPHDGSGVFSPPGSWATAVQALSRVAAAALSDDSRIWRPQVLDPARDPGRRLADATTLPGLIDVVEIVATQLEERLYGCRVVVDKVHVYRQVPVRMPPPRGGSWVWHADGHPSEFVKALVYLSDVTRDSSVFQLLWSPDRNRALRAVSSPMRAGNWASGEARSGVKVDDAFVRRWASKGYVERSMIGPAGTTAIFNTNCLHRGTMARSTPRDTLVLRIRPTAQRFAPRLTAKAAVKQYELMQGFAT